MSAKTTMKYRMAGFLAVAAMLGFLAALVGIFFHQIPVDNRDFFNMGLVALIGFVSTAFGYYLGSSQGSARKTELQSSQGPLEPIVTGGGAIEAKDQSGSIHIGNLMAMAFATLALAFMVVGIGLQGCAPNQSVTRQIASQTDDPGTIVLAAYADAQDAYIEVLELYRPYKTILQQTNPSLDVEIVGYFRQANRILDDWEAFGDVPQGDKTAFRDYLREISLRLAVMLEQKRGGDQ